MNRVAEITIKIERAKRHVSELEEEVKRFLDTKPYRVSAKIDQESKRPVYFLSYVQDTPSTFAAITGDVLQNLRSSLDHLAYQLVLTEANGKQSFRHVYFPISEDHKDYSANSRKKTMGMSQEAVKVIDSLKPYKGGNDTLWKIHRLNIIDKHRLLITVGSAYHSVDIGSIITRRMKNVFKETFGEDFPDEMIVPLFLKPADRLFPLKVGARLFEDAEGVEIDPLMQFRFDIAFGEPHVVEGEPLLETLYKMIEEVEKVLQSLKPFLKR